jgi:Cys-rich four helix bundle protein (predicted Tat secretion target)
MDTTRRSFIVQSSISLATAAVSSSVLTSVLGASEVQAGEKAAKKADPKADATRVFVRAAHHCMETGELCVAHCSKELAQGNVEMAKCNTSVQAMMAVCAAASKLVALGSSQAKKAVELCAAVCKECAEACEEHKAHFGHGMHLECKTCGEACREMEKACKAWLSA